MSKSLRAALAAFVVVLASILSPSSAHAAAAKVVRVTIVSAAAASRDSSVNTNGHSFLMFTNISSTPKTMIIGVLGISKGKTVTVGTWGNRRDGQGIYYNLESYFGASGFAGRVSASVDITEDQLGPINNYIRKNNAWSELNNCATFAEMTWFQSIRPSPSAGTPRTPEGLMNGIKKLSIGYTTNVSIPSATLSQVYRQDGTSSYHTANI
ncbi:MAG: hypothetical protein WAS54_08325 [Scrofimicrobium sp.]